MGDFTPEIPGYPISINLIGDRSEDPCDHLYYKKPELTPEKYFKRKVFAENFEYDLAIKVTG